MTWPFTQEMVKRNIKGLEECERQQRAWRRKSERDRIISILGLIMMIEQLSWGDAGQYLCLPHPMLGGAAVDSAGTPEQRIRFLRKFTEGEPKWGAMAITEAGCRLGQQFHAHNGRFG